MPDLNDIDTTPPPRRPTGVTPTLGPDTHVRFDLVRVVAIFGGLCVAVWIVAQTYFSMTWRMEKLEERLTAAIGALATKTDVAGIREDAMRAARERLRGAIVRCPRLVARGETTAVCELVWGPSE